MSKIFLNLTNNMRNLAGNGNGTMEHTTDFLEKDNRKKLELYLHIPFCVKKCSYCDFLSMPAEETVRRHYLHMLLEEIRENAACCKEYQVSTIFFGGGTPSLLPGGQIAELMEALQENFTIDADPEITIECNPGTLDKQKLSCYKDSGINRLSLGLQSANNRELQLLGRIHSFEDFLENFAAARSMGFENINVDLISALPGQTTKDWSDTLKKVLALQPEHISAYSLMIEEGTPFYETYREDEMRRERGERPRYLPEEETEREMYEQTRIMLEQEGFRRYEISNFARPGRECRHNIGYWRGTPYLGFGLGSSSYIEGMRYTNPCRLEEYLKGSCRNLGRIRKKRWDISSQERHVHGIPESSKEPCADGISESSKEPCAHGIPESSEELCAHGIPESSEDSIWVLSKQEQMEEFMFLGLRMADGISRKEFWNRFQAELSQVYGDVLQKLQSQGLLAQKEEHIYLTEAGITVSNYVLSEFLLS